MIRLNNILDGSPFYDQICDGPNPWSKGPVPMPEMSDPQSSARQYFIYCMSPNNRQHESYSNRGTK